MKLSRDIKILSGGIIVVVSMIGYVLLEAHVLGPPRKAAEEAKERRVYFASMTGLYPLGHAKNPWHGRPVWSDADLKRWSNGPRSRRAHVVHFRSRLTVNGYPILFEEFFECVHGSRQGYVRKDYKPRRLVSKKLPDGSVVFTVFLGRLCGKWAKSWGRSDRKVNPEKVRDRRPPENFLMRFYWADHSINPTRIEAYLSHAYHKQKKRRLVMHTHELRLAPYPTPEKILKEAERQAKADLPLPFLDRKSMQHPRWRALFGVVMEESEWATHPILKAAVAGLSAEQKFTDIADPIAQKEVFSAKSRVGVDWSIFRYGIPYPGKNHQLLLPGPTRDALKHLRGTIIKRSWETLDDARPVHCQKGVCRILANERGYLIFHRACYDYSFCQNGEMKLRDLWHLEIDGVRIPYRRPTRLLFWRPTRTLIVLNSAKM